MDNEESVLHYPLSIFHFPLSSAFDKNLSYKNLAVRRVRDADAGRRPFGVENILAVRRQS